MLIIITYTYTIKFLIYYLGYKVFNLSFSSVVSKYFNRWFYTYIKYYSNILHCSHNSSTGNIRNLMTYLFLFQKRKYFWKVKKLHTATIKDIKSFAYNKAFFCIYLVFVLYTGNTNRIHFCLFVGTYTYIQNSNLDISTFSTVYYIHIFNINHRGHGCFMLKYSFLIPNILRVTSKKKKINNTRQFLSALNGRSIFFPNS